MLLLSIVWHLLSNYSVPILGGWGRKMSKLWFLSEGTYILMKKPLHTISINGKLNTLKYAQGDMWDRREPSSPARVRSLPWGDNFWSEF